MVSVLSPTTELEPEEVERVTAVTYLARPTGRWPHSGACGLATQRHCAGELRPRVSLDSFPGSRLRRQARDQGPHSVAGTELIREDSNVRRTMVHLPALNTPQFDLVKSRLPLRPRPVAPVYQPEVAADAILWVIERAPRDCFVGFSVLRQ